MSSFYYGFIALVDNWNRGIFKPHRSGAVGCKLLSVKCNHISLKLRARNQAFGKQPSLHPGINLLQDREKVTNKSLKVYGILTVTIRACGVAPDSLIQGI
jgi:hypothetical protein